MAKPFKLASLPDYQCYSCQGCGNCCRGLFIIRLNPDDVARITEQHWEEDPAYQGREIIRMERGNPVLAFEADGTCIFLDERGLCRIHAKFGEPAKPLACRTYPFKLIPTGDRVHADLRFDCPAIPANEGKAICEHRADILDLLPLVLPPGAAEVPAPSLFLESRMTWEGLATVTDTFVRLLRRPEHDLITRVVACVNLSAAIRSRALASLDGPTLQEFMNKIFLKMLEVMSKDPMRRLRPLPFERLALHQLIGVYGREDRRGEKNVTMKRLSAALRMLLARGPVPPLRAGFPRVPFSALDAEIGPLSAEAAEPLERYLRYRLESHGFYGMGFYNYPFLDGLNALLLTVPLTLWFARVYAADAGLPAPDRACIEKGIQIVNHQHGLLPIFRHSLERMRFRILCERSTLRRLVIWYGR